MSNIVPIASGIDWDLVPTFAKQKSAVAVALDGSLNSGIRRLSIKGGTFRYIAGGQEIGKIDERFLNIVLVNAAPHVSRTWYAKDYDSNAKAEAPDCWSTDGTVPDEKARNKQHVNCVSCPKNAKGSGRGDSKACRYNQRLAIVLANDIGGEVLQLQLPATSLFGEGNKEAGATLQGYYKALAARTIDPAALITQVKFDTDVESPKLGFTAVSWLSQEQHELAVSQGKSEAAQRAITMTVFEADGVDTSADVALPSGVPPSKEQTAIQKAAVKASPDTKSDKAAKPDEPIVRKGTDVSPATNPKIASLIEKWGADDE